MGMASAAIAPSSAVYLETIFIPPCWIDNGRIFRPALFRHLHGCGSLTEIA
jgi:hypothetical protein